MYSWERITGNGYVYSYTVVYRAAGPAFEDKVPFTIVLVTLDEGPTMMANLVDQHDDGIAIGMSVRLCYEDINDQVTLPMFVPR